MSEPTVSVLDGNTFVLGDRHGDVRADSGREHGFFSEDTRFLSRWVLRVDDRPLDLLGLEQDTHFAAQFFLTPRLGPDEAAPYSVMRRRCVDRVWLEEITVVNHRPGPTAVSVALDVQTDFADLFEVKDDVIAPREISARIGDDSLELAYEHAGFHRSVTIIASLPAEISAHGLHFGFRLERGDQWTVALRVTPHAAQPATTFPARTLSGGFDEVRRAKADELDAWLASTPTLETADSGLARTYRASLTDLAALRLQADLGEPATLPAAGLPWFMALFGRDSLITSFQALPYLPTLAAATLRVLAARQARNRDDFHEQEPGKILHELRLGELTATGRRPHSPYYGTADATPLFVVLLDEYHRWTGDDALVRELEPNARAALAWMEDGGDPDGDGYVEYARRNLSTGLINQCWKDSWDSMQRADGSLATGPIATCEIQGYVYDARRRAARLARGVWGDPVFGAQLDDLAAELRGRFRVDFWMPERRAYALALDGDKRQVDSLTSNIGHLLWSGIAGEEDAADTAERLLDTPLYSGWGVRTLAAGEGGYNPLGYHTGTVWPHENSLIAAGLARYGHQSAATRIACAILSAAPHFEHRLPEVFAGYPASLTSVPVAFPTASRPQAWAAGAPLMLLSTLLELEPGMTDAAVDVPGPIGRISLRRRSLVASGR
ncbi:MAG TPA: glycogen debranching N-terminal domain-containing protein [Solirubrobacteraceae bacterium]|jgi:glycogen debranching enzyme|nr:glycogen debranching N-terminal domain-containing protein [Solirubrobacteraceae bacterium]